ncbi:hypothetical protein NXC24_PC01388 (plasmid) [Rhizobium sp. NXC24]|nr:hypothetical protein NXC24_PC01388 [Rhizobium sp. NXC24]
MSIDPSHDVEWDCPHRIGAGQEVWSIGAASKGEPPDVRGTTLNAAACLLFSGSDGRLLGTISIVVAA